MTAPCLRRATVNDVRSIAEVHIAAWRAAYRGLMPDSHLAELSVETKASLWQQSLTEPNPGTLIVAESDRTVGAFCFFGPTRDADGKDKRVGEILSLNVRPELWRRGFGQVLCEFVLSEAPHRQWTTVTLWVLKGNERACRFYEALGFFQDGTDRTQTSLIGVPLHEVRYQKIVSPGAA
jgi:ribosomal protein S18 acetylase RimI-like enzyme